VSTLSPSRSPSPARDVPRHLDCNLAGVVVPWDERLIRPPFTVEVWAKVPATEPTSVLVAIGPPNSGDRWQLAVSADGQIVADVGGRTPGNVRSDAKAADGGWHRWAMSFDGETVRFFIDGKPAGETATKPQPRAAVNGPLVIGTDVRPSSPQASVALVREIRFAATAEMQEIASTTIGLWHPGEADAEGIVPNLIGNELHGLLRAAEPGISLDALDRRSFHAGPLPMQGPATAVSLTEGRLATVRGPHRVSLDGLWAMARDGEEAVRLSSDWNDAIPAAVPGSVHGSLGAAGIIPDPKFGQQDSIARAMSFRTWWFRTTFARPEGTGHRLTFDGVAIHCTVWLNGRRLGEHEGMFGGPSFEVADLLRDENELIVKIDPAGFDKDWFWGSNASWRKTVVFNCVYGWHYSDIPALGIWRSVHLDAAPTVKLCGPFVTTTDLAAGEIGICVELRSGLAGDRVEEIPPGTADPSPQPSPSGGEGAVARRCAASGSVRGCRGLLRGVIEPKNFDGTSHTFEVQVEGNEPSHALRLSTRIPDAKLWWPNGCGEQNLYRLRLQFEPREGVADVYETTFGLRTVEMRPPPDGPHPKRYNWTFVINGRPMFVKGSGWCTLDASMDFRRERYERFLRAAQQEHCQMLRAWGGGMPETDDFYDLCDELGIMVMQEWPTAWNSHNVQPIDVLEETVRLNTLRLRNRASLVMWGAGNESSAPEGEAIDMMGRLAIELDGTRPFHRGEAWGGSDHNYDCWWNQKHLDHNLNMTARFWGEFGVPSFPNLASVLRYLPEDEKTLWPPKPDGSFWHHTPVFNRAGEQERFHQYAGYFTAGATMERFILGTQLAQAVGARHTLERARTRWPDCSGALLYKLNDNYPAGSWSTVDWYGATKPAHWFVRSAFTPVHACLIFDTLNLQGAARSLPVFLLDDSDELANDAWEVLVTVYGPDLRPVTAQRFGGSGAIDRVKPVGLLRLTTEQASLSPLFGVAEVHVAGRMVDRTFYFVNFEGKPDCLFELPPTRLALRAEGSSVTVTNVGDVPAVGVTVEGVTPERFEVSDGAFWLGAGESRTVSVNYPAGITVSAWNA